MLATLLAIIAISDTPDLHDKKSVFDIDAGPARVTLMNWMRAGNVHGMFSPNGFVDIRTHDIKGVFTACQALSRMLDGIDVIVLNDDGSAACPEIPIPLKWSF